VIIRENARKGNLRTNQSWRSSYYQSDVTGFTIDIPKSGNSAHCTKINNKLFAESPTAHVEFFPEKNPKQLAEANAMIKPANLGGALPT